jgi:hypothetical protein
MRPRTPRAVDPNLQKTDRTNPDLQKKPTASVPSAILPVPPTPFFDSRIISHFPEIFAEFKKKRFSLLWRGSRDGFGASAFHRRCDGHANALTVILDTEGNILGGFTPVERESPVWNGSENNCWKADNSEKSFLFTLKNPHSIPARRFVEGSKEARGNQV